MHHGKITKDIAAGLQVLRRRIKRANIPSSKLDETLNIATWNIREFGKRKRRPASLHYIAEIIGQFDLVSIVELRDDVSDLAEVMRYLGPYWDVVFSDYITDSGGNHERIGMVYDRRAVTFTGLASNANAPRKKVGGEYIPKVSFWRPPYLASFRAGNFDFILLATHVRWGGDNEKARLPELTLLADWVGAREKERFVFDKDLIVLGDFNIPDRESPLFKAITRRGLKVPDALLGTHGTNLAADKRYDQILHLQAFTKSFTNHGGSLDFFQKDYKSLYPRAGLSQLEFTFEMSDHLPLWVQINTDNDDEQLDQILNPKKR